MSEEEFPTLGEWERPAPIQQGAPSPRAPPSQRDLRGRELKPRTKRRLFLRELHQRITTSATTARTRGRGVQPHVSRTDSTVPSWRGTGSGRGGWGTGADAADGGGVSTGRRHVSSGSRTPLKLSKKWYYNTNFLWFSWNHPLQGNKKHSLNMRWTLFKSMHAHKNVQ
jgi:hypothetical protein